MSWLLFMDESGHDHKSMPYEVRGGVAIHAEDLWHFVQDIRRLELACFGGELHQFKKEIKGCKLLDRDRFKWAAQGPTMDAEERRKLSRGFMTKGLEHKPPKRDEFTAYGQACLEMARGIFQSLRDHGAKLFAAAIPRSVEKPDTYEAAEFLRKDQVFLFERYFNFLEQEHEDGLLVMDEVEETADRQFVRRMQAYFERTQTGRQRTAWIVPTPFFVSSNLTYPVQAADLAIYCVNWGFRLPNKGMDATTRPEIASEFGPWMKQIQSRTEVYDDGEVFEQFGIVFVRDPYTAR